MPADTGAVCCCIAGGGPAGMMLGTLLARAGVDVVVLEKHADFLRDFRGDTIHPSTLEIMHELGWLDEFLQLPHQKVRQLTAVVGSQRVTIADLGHLPTRCKFIAFMPQWDFLNFLALRAARYPGFRLWMRAEATDLVEESGRVVGVRVTTPEGTQEVRADLVVAADGRHSVLRERAGLAIEELGAPMDVLWFKLSRRPDDPGGVMGQFGSGRIFVMLDRGDYWQCGFVIAKGTIESLRARGMEAFREQVALLSPWIKDRTTELRDWGDMSLLTVRVDRLRQWYRTGLLCIGDAAHAMSPVGGVGINLAIQDAVASANLLAAPLRERRVTDDDLRRVQRRRELPTRVIQRFQVIVQRRVIGPVLSSTGPPRAPLILRLLAQLPGLPRIPARLIGMGVRPERVRTPEAPLYRPGQAG
ncbi:MAG TPA: FAD-dependent oxidoreductase [Methylomirabilota bacterium]|nr:FAD-dependent oxidoreductase [Methylomirabilota bacterium]